MRLFFSILITALATSGAYAGVPTSPAGDGGHVTVPTFVNGAGPYPFILDTGADGSVVYQWFADQMHLASAGDSDDLNGMTGSTHLARYRIQSLKLDGHEVKGLVVDALPNRKDKGTQAGALGTDFMAGKVAVFDLACHKIELHSRAGDMTTIVSDAGTPIHAEHAGDTGLLQIPVRINGASGVAVLDTGNRVSKLNSTFARQAHIDAGSVAFHDEEPIQGVALKPMTPRSGPIGRVEFGEIRLEGVHAQVIDMPVMTQVDGQKPVLWLGSDLLQTVRLVYDHDGERVWFRKSSCAENER